MVDDAMTSVLETLMIDGKMVLDESQKTFAYDLLSEFANQLLQQGNVSHPNISAFIIERIRQIDELITAQLNEFLHDPQFLKLEGA